jgi:hypothetical protein
VENHLLSRLEAGSLVRPGWFQEACRPRRALFGGFWAF